MPVGETTKLKIVCDNPACPGNELSTTERAGWVIVSAEVYGDPSVSGVYCSTGCLSADAERLLTPAEPAVE
jgi:hypothetical protein